MTVVLVPLSLIVLVFIILILWFWKCRLERSKQKKQEALSQANAKCRFCFLTKSNESCCFSFRKEPPNGDAAKIKHLKAGETGRPYAITHHHGEQLGHCKADTLSSHFEDNNWDYNFAMRGLYLRYTFCFFIGNDFLLGIKNYFS